MSASDHTDTHGKKLYFFFTKAREAYREENSKHPFQPVGQAIVKESWTPREVPENLGTLESDATGRYIRYAERNGKAYYASERRELFIMYKLPPSMPNTDREWFYGVVSADGKTVVESGPIASCMACHTKAPRDRMFGLPSE